MRHLMRAEDRQPFEEWWAESGRTGLLKLLRSADPAGQRGGAGIAPHSYDGYLERLKPELRRRAGRTRIEGILIGARAVHGRASDPVADARLAAAIADWFERERG
jgi:hypothetical protein